MILAYWLVQLTYFTGYHQHTYVRTYDIFVYIIYHIYESSDENTVMVNLFETIVGSKTYLNLSALNPNILIFASFSNVGESLNQHNFSMQGKLLSSQICLYFVAV